MSLPAAAAVLYCPPSAVIVFVDGRNDNEFSARVPFFIERPVSFGFLPAFLQAGRQNMHRADGVFSRQRVASL